MATELEKLAACDAHAFYRDTCCYCERNRKLLRDGRALGHEEAAKVCEAAENCSSAMVKLAGHDCHVQDAAAIRELSKSVK